tara:strand:+ start:65 stop:400 length:336 start_codon:yes stop_codon:yes gene_type:complete
MNTIKIFQLFIFIAVMTSCSNADDSNSQNPIDQLPAATQTGANTFGCLLDGEAFIPNGGINPLDCVYQFVNGSYFFSLQGNKRDSQNNLELIGLSTNNLQIFENQTYIFEN